MVNDTVPHDHNGTGIKSPENINLITAAYIQCTLRLAADKQQLERLINTIICSYDPQTQHKQ